MYLTSSDGASLHLEVLGYEYPGADPAHDEWDANWLLLGGAARTACGTAWSFRDPALTTWELTDLVTWLDHAADGGDDQPYWWDQLHDAGWLTFVEPNLSFAVSRYGGGLVHLEVGLGAGLAPPPRPERAHAWWPLLLALTRGQLRDAAATLRAGLDDYPVR